MPLHILEMALRFLQVPTVQQLIINFLVADRSIGNRAWDCKASQVFTSRL